jgi:hypothetical protein
MKLYIFNLLKIVKKIIDKAYYNQYTYNRETLVREMFPWIVSIWEYKEIDSFLRHWNITQTNDIVRAIWAFYWGKVKELTSAWKYVEIEKYQWLLDFCQSIRDYQEYILTIEKK